MDDGGVHAMSRQILIGLVAISSALAVPAAAEGLPPLQPYTHRTAPNAVGTGGAAASVDSVATDAAIRVLRDGGNAVDAAVTAAGVLGVVEPYSCGIGGGGFMVIRTPKGRVTTLDGRESAPAAMRPDAFLENGQPLAFDAARWSGLSAGVPGTPALWRRALRSHGTWKLRRALQPGIRAAERGFTVDKVFFDATTAAQAYFDDLPATAALYLDPDGTPRDIGAVQRHPDMARTYRRMARLGVRRGFYRGPVAEAMAAAARKPPVGSTSDHTWRPGQLTRADLRGYRVRERAPTQVDYKDYRVFSMPAPSSGGTTVGEALNILAQSPAYASGSEVDKLHHFIEASRYAFADRNRWVADPAFYDTPQDGLLSRPFAAQRAVLIGPQAANAVVAPGTPPGAPDAAAQSGAFFSRTQSTTHLTVADADGMVVSYTFTIESTGGNGIVVPGWGFLLNNELTDFNIDDPTHPNAPAGGKRPRSSMAPTYVEKGGQPFLALGSPGGATIITTVLQTLLARMDLGKPLPEAVAMPRASQRNLAATPYEQAFADTYAAALIAEHGHRFAPAATAELGAVAAVEFLPGGRFQAAAEPVRRGGGSARVVKR